MNEIITTDLPKGLKLTPIETQIIRDVTSGIRAKDISMKLGIPLSAITQLVRRKEVKEFIQECVDARNLVLKMELPNVLMGMLQDKIDAAVEQEVRLGDTTKKDAVDIIKQLSDMLKSTGSNDTEDTDGFTKIYQQFNMIQGE